MARFSRHASHSAAQADVEEIEPNRFYIRDPRANPIMKGEGELRGRIFELTSKRRDGMLARLRANGLSVAALEDQIDALPHLPAVAPSSIPLWRRLAGSERYSHFDLQSLRWEPLPPVEKDGAPGISAPAGAPLRRRKHRGAPDYYLAGAERGDRLRLLPASELEALLTGYALASANQWIRLSATLQGDHDLLPAVELPEPHRALLGRLGRLEGQQISTPRPARQYVQAVFESLGIQLSFH
jgi:hypothetical protein